jgi:hypothetical protein
MEHFYNIMIGAMIGSVWVLALMCLWQCTRLFILLRREFTVKGKDVVPLDRAVEIVTAYASVNKEAAAVMSEKLVQNSIRVRP